jgi:hypothetical protein
MAFVQVWIAQALIALVAIMWLIPDPRIARQVESDHRTPDPGRAP